MNLSENVDGVSMPGVGTRIFKMGGAIFQLKSNLDRGG